MHKKKHDRSIYWEAPKMRLNLVLYGSGICKIHTHRITFQKADTFLSRKCLWECLNAHILTHNVNDIGDNWLQASYHFCGFATCSWCSFALSVCVYAFHPSYQHTMKYFLTSHVQNNLEMFISIMQSIARDFFSHLLSCHNSSLCSSAISHRCQPLTRSLSLMVQSIWFIIRLPIF